MGIEWKVLQYIRNAIRFIALIIESFRFVLFSSYEISSNTFLVTINVSKNDIGEPQGGFRGNRKQIKHI